LNDQATVRSTTTARLAQEGPRLSVDETASDAALWADVTSAKDMTVFAQAWLAIVGRSSPSIIQSALLYGPANRGPYEPVARWSRSQAASDAGRLSRGSASILAAISESRQPAIEAVDGNEEARFAGIPLMVGDELYGSVLVEAKLADTAAARRLMRHLQWGSAWVEGYLRRSLHIETSELSRRATLMIDIINAIISEGSHAGACRMLATRLAETFRCERVAVGQHRNKKSTIAAVFQSASFERKQELGLAIEAAMDEAIDQGVALITPSPPSSSFVAAAQEALVRLNDKAAILTVPIMHRDKPVGAVVLERFSGEMFTQEELDLCDALCAASGPILVDKEERDWGVHRIAAHRALQFAGKFTGTGHLGYKVGGALVLAVALFLIFAKDTFRIHAHAQIQGQVRRVINAPFDGYIRAQHARAGQVVREGGLLAELQDNDLALDRLRHIAQRRQYKLELDRALSRRDLAASGIARSQVEQKDAEIELSESMLERAQLRAPFDSVVVAGDLSQAVGRPVSRGDVLFELAPLDKYRVTLVVPEMEIQSVRVGQTGQVLLTALPEKPFEFVVQSITPVARVVEGVNGFEVLADLKEPDPRLRPAMEGVAKIDAGRRSFVWIWTHELMYWLRVKLWALIP